jgi:hypothetical protein
VQQQQQLLDGLAADLQRHSSNSSSSGWRAAGVRQQMMERLQRWKAGDQVLRGPAERGDATSLALVAVVFAPQ